MGIVTVVVAGVGILVLGLLTLAALIYIAAMGSYIVSMFGKPVKDFVEGVLRL
jgi:hypothetical protein